jgi:hypothetical protein
LKAVEPNDDESFGRYTIKGGDLRPEPLDVRKATLATVLTRAAPGLRLN